MTRKKAPYFDIVNSTDINTVCIVCTGSEAWERAKMQHWIKWMPKTLLPPGHDPQGYIWPVNHRYTMIVDFGENIVVITDLVKCLLSFGATKVLLITDDEVTTFARSNG